MEAGSSRCMETDGIEPLELYFYEDNKKLDKVKLYIYGRYKACLSCLKI